MAGKFRTIEELNEYESLWHNRIFLPARLELREKVNERIFLTLSHRNPVLPLPSHLPPLPSLSLPVFSI